MVVTSFVKTDLKFNTFHFIITEYVDTLYCYLISYYPFSFKDILADKKLFVAIGAYEDDGPEDLLLLYKSKNVLQLVFCLLEFHLCRVSA